MKLTSIICLMCIHCVLCENCVIDNGSWDLNKERKLHKDVLCNYDIFEQPNNNTFVTVRIILKYFHFDSNEEIFTMYSWFFLSWVDNRLQWDPKDYDGITGTQLYSYQIWTPELKHHTKIIYDDFDKILNTMCQVSSKGFVLCVSQMISDTECQTDLNHWPYDTQKCTFKYGTHVNNKDNVVLTFNLSRGISMFGAEYGPGWNIMDFEKGENASSETQLYLAFVVERQAESLGSITIFPSVVLSILTISSLFLDIGNTRGGIAILSLLGHFYIQQFINSNIPVNSSTAPSILHLITTSFAVTCFSVLLTITLSLVLKRKNPPQQWVVAVNEFVFKSSIKFLIWPRWEVKKKDAASSETESAFEVWIGFANIVNSASIVIIIIVYISILMSFIPKQTSFD